MVERVQYLTYRTNVKSFDISTDTKRKFKGFFAQIKLLSSRPLPTEVLGER